MVELSIIQHNLMFRGLFDSHCIETNRIKQYFIVVDLLGIVSDDT